MSPELYLSFLIATLIILIVPGPTVLTVISLSINHGKKSTLPLIAGVVLGDFTAMSFSLAGLGAILRTSAALFSFFKWAGALYLIYLGTRTLIEKEPGPKQNTGMDGSPGSGLFKSSFIVTVFNPKSIPFFVAFFPQFVNPSGNTAAQLLLMGCSFLLLAAMNVFMYSSLASRMVLFIRKDWVRKTLKGLSGGALLGTGILTATLKKV